MKDEKSEAGKVAISGDDSIDNYDIPVDVVTTTNKKTKTKLNIKYIGFGVGGVLVLLILVWAIGITSFRHFQIDNALVSTNLNDAQLAIDLNRPLNLYKLSIAYPNGITKSFTLNQIGASVNVNKTINQISSKKNSLNSMLAWWNPIIVNYKVSINPSVYNNFISTNNNVTVQPAKNASISIINGSATLTSAVDGKEYGIANFNNLVSNSVSQLDNQTINFKTINLIPNISDSQLSNEEATLNQTLKQTVTITIGGQTISPSVNEIASWINVNNSPNQASTLSVNSTKVSSYLESLANDYSTPLKDAVEATEANGSLATIESGVNGQIVSSNASLVNSVVANLTSGKSVSIAMPTTTTPYQTITAGNWNKWIEVNVSTKRMYVYVGSQLVNTFLVSAGKPSTPTPLGTFHIIDKLPLQTMTGPGYVQPDVPWINYFNNDGDAIHGNYWRPTSYFGNINSSHGCVGLMVADAKWVYDWAPLGTPIIIHA